MAEAIYKNYLSEIQKLHAQGNSMRAIGRMFADRLGVSQNAARIGIQRILSGRDYKPGVLAMPTISRDASFDELPEGEACELTSRKINGVSRLAVISDVHIPYYSKEAVVAAIKWLKEFKPDTILLNGDIMDFYPINRFSVNPRKPDLKYEFEVWHMFAQVIRHQFKNANIYFKQGNHELRLPYVNTEEDLHFNSCQEETDEDPAEDGVVTN